MLAGKILPDPDIAVAGVFQPLGNGVTLIIAEFEEEHAAGNKDGAGLHSEFFDQLHAGGAAVERGLRLVVAHGGR